MRIALRSGLNTGENRRFQTSKHGLALDASWSTHPSQSGSPTTVTRHSDPFYGGYVPSKNIVDLSFDLFRRTATIQAVPVGHFAQRMVHV